MLGSDRPPEALAQHTGFLMNWCAERSRRRFAQALAEHGLHPREFGVLSVIAAHPGIPQQAIGEAAGVDPSTMVATIDALQERGLAERHPHPTDRRKRAVRLTPQGEEVLRETRAMATELGDEVFAPLTHGEREELHRLLRKLAGLET
jgi:DNA-binding MarR family transcriptional regulator